MLKLKLSGAQSQLLSWYTHKLYIEANLVVSLHNFTIINYLLFCVMDLYKIYKYAIVLVIAYLFYFT